MATLAETLQLQLSRRKVDPNIAQQLGLPAGQNLLEVAQRAGIAPDFLGTENLTPVAPESVTPALTAQPAEIQTTPLTDADLALFEEQEAQRQALQPPQEVQTAPLTAQDLERFQVQESPAQQFLTRSDEELFADPEFSPVALLVAYPELRKDPQAMSRLQDIHARKRAAGVDWSRVAWKGLTGAPTMMKDIVRSVAVDLPKNLAIVNNPVASPAERRAAALKLQAAVELGAVTTADLVGGGLSKYIKAIEKTPLRFIPGFGIPAAKLARAGAREAGFAMPEPKDANQLLERDVAIMEQIQNVASGKGEVTSRVVVGPPLAPLQVAKGEAPLVEDLAKEGIEVDPEEISRLSIPLNPTNFIPLGGGLFGVVNQAGKVIAKVPGLLRLGATIERINQMAPRVILGAPIKGVGKGAEVAGKQVSRAAAVAGGLAGFGPMMAGGGMEPLSAVAAGLVAGVGGKALEASGKRLASLGVDIMSNEPRGLLARAIVGTADVVGQGAVEGTVAGLPFLMMADDQQEAEQLAAGNVGFGIAGRAARPVALAAGKGINRAALLAADRVFREVSRSEVSSPAYGTDPVLDAAHNAAMETARQRGQGGAISFFREIARPLGIEIYAIPGQEMAARFPGVQEPQGWTSERVTLPDGTQRTQIYLNADQTTGRTAAHEFGHAAAALIEAAAPDRMGAFADQIARLYAPESIERGRFIYNVSLFGIDPATGQPRQQISPEQYIRRELMAETLATLFQGNTLQGAKPGVVDSALLGLGSMLEQLGLYRPTQAEPAAMAAGAPGTFGGLGLEPSFRLQEAAGELVRSTLGELRLPEGPQQPPVLPAEPAPGGPRPPTLPLAAPGAETPPAPGRGALAAATVRAAVEATRTPPPPPGLEAGPEESGPKTAENLRLGLEQRRSVEQPLDHYGAWEEVNRFIQASEDVSPEVKATWDKIYAERAKYADRDMPPLEVFYRSVTPSEAGRPPLRVTRRSDQAEAYVAEQAGKIDPALRTLFQKTSSIYNTVLRRNKDGTLNLNFWAFSPDKALGNALLAAKLATEAKASELVPYALNADGSFAEGALPALAADLTTYVQNQARGFTGSGQRINRQAAGAAGFRDYLPPEVGAPTRLDPAKADFINLIMGLNPPATSITRGGQRRALPANLVARFLAESQGRQVVPSRMAAPGVFGRGSPRKGQPRNLFLKRDYPNLLQRDIPIGEANPLREEFIRRGVDPDTIRESLTEAIEELSIEQIDSVRAAPEVPVRGVPSISMVRGGFKGPDIVRTVAAMSPDEFAAFARELNRKGVGVTGEAWRIGAAGRRDPEMGRLLKDSQTVADAEAWSYVDSGQFEMAPVVSLKAQFFREGYETLTDTASAAAAARRPGMEGQKPPVNDPNVINYELVRISKSLANDVAKIASGESFGTTLNLDGTTFDPQGRDLDVVTLGSKDIPLAELTPDRIVEELAAFDPVLEGEYIKPGIFKLDRKGPNGEDLVSIDINVVTDAKNRENTVAFARDNNQQAIYNLGKGELIDTGGDGKTVITDPAEMAQAAKALAEGRKHSVARPGASGGVVIPKPPEKPAPGPIPPQGEAPEGSFKPRKVAKAEDIPDFGKNPAIWVYPDGSVVRVQESTHENHLSQNREALKKRFKVSFSNEASVQDRNKALGKGFVRVRYRPDGQLVFEMAPGMLEKVRGTLEEVFLANEEKVDNVLVSVIQPEPFKVVDSVRGQFYDFATGEGVEGPAKFRAFVDTLDAVRSRPGQKSLRAGDYLPPKPGIAIEQIMAPAMKEIDSKTVHAGQPGWAHFMIMVRLPEDVQARKMEAGFVTTKGRFLNREEAYELAIAAKQIREEVAGALAAGGWANMPRFGLETEAFKVAQEVEAGKTKIEGPPEVLGGAFKPATPVFEREAPMVRSKYSGDADAEAWLDARNAQAPDKIPIDFRRSSTGRIELGGNGKPLIEKADYNFRTLPEWQQVFEAAEGRVREREAKADQAITDYLGDQIKKTWDEVPEMPEWAKTALEWYPEAERMIKEKFGDEWGDFFAQLLAATSPNTDPEQNFAYALEAYNLFRLGAYNEKIAKFVDAVERFNDGSLGREWAEAKGVDKAPAPDTVKYYEPLRWWLNKNEDAIVPTKLDGTKFGYHSPRIMQVLAGKWLNLNRGLKTENFYGNLIGKSLEATIDVWASRFLWRLMNEGKREKWRFDPMMESGITDPSYRIAEKAFRKAADSLNLEPRQLQAFMWYLEKNYAEAKGWSDKSSAEAKSYLDLLPAVELTEEGALAPVGEAFELPLAREQIRAPEIRQLGKTTEPPVKRTEGAQELASVDVEPF